MNEDADAVAARPLVAAGAAAPAENRGAAMVCSVCGHEGLFESRIASVFRVRDGSAAIGGQAGLAVIRDIPAVVCPGCKEEFVDDATSVRLDRMRAGGFASETAVETMSVPVFAFRAGNGRRS